MSQAAAHAYLKPAGPLKPADAAVALIMDEQERYLVQLRDPIPTIFFPDHWGCFGGALEDGESYEQALARELHEELALDVSDHTVTRFTNYTFDFSFAGGGIINRCFFQVRVPAAIERQLTLSEGAQMRFIPGPELLQKQVVPYDRFAIWMHTYRRELARPAAGATR